MFVVPDVRTRGACSLACRTDRTCDGWAFHLENRNCYATFGDPNVTWVLDISFSGEYSAVRDSENTLRNCATLDEMGGYFYGIAGFQTFTGMHIFNNGGGFKFSRDMGYYDIYEPHMEHCAEFCNLLELGVNTGVSLAVWSTFFPQGRVVGVDISFSQWHGMSRESLLGAMGANASGLVEILELDYLTADEADLRALGGFDIIVDDGDHRAESQIRAFERLFPILESGGVYIIEDVHRDERSRRVFDYVAELEAKFVRLVDFRSPTLYARKTSMDAHRYEMQDMDWRYHISSVHTYAHCIVIKKSVTCITRESSRSGSETVQEPCRFSRTR